MTALVPLTSLAVLGTAPILETAAQLSALPRSKVAAGAEQVAQRQVTPHTERRGSSINTGATDQIVGLPPKSLCQCSGCLSHRRSSRASAPEVSQTSLFGDDE
jgi:hypothetical protein